MTSILFLLMCILLCYSTARQICFNPNTTCGTPEIYKHTIHFGGNDFIGKKISVIPNDTILYENITHFIAENICDNYTLITGLSKHQYTREQQDRNDAYTLYGVSGSIMGMTTEQKVHIGRRVVIHEPINLIGWKTNLGNTLYPDPPTTALWWNHFYNLLKTSSIIQVKTVRDMTKDITGETYNLDCENGKILVLADVSCLFLHNQVSSEIQRFNVGSMKHKVKYGGVSAETCARKIPKVFSGSVVVKVPAINLNKSRSCTTMHYICASGQPTARVLHVIRRDLNAPAMMKQDMSMVHNKEYIFECSCLEADYSTKIDSLSSMCVFNRTHLYYDMLEVLNNEIHTVIALCKLDPNCHYDTPMQNSLRPCNCVSLTKGGIEHYNNAHGILKNPTAFDTIEPCKSWIPHGAKDLAAFAPPFKKVVVCHDTINKESPNNDYVITSNTGTRRRLLGVSPSVCAGWLCVSFKKKKDGVSVDDFNKLQDSIRESLTSAHDAFTRQQKHINIVTNRVNRNSYQIVDLSSTLEDVILNINNDLTIVEDEIANIHMQIQLNRIQTAINELNIQNIRNFIVGMHKTKLLLAGNNFKIDEKTGCVDIPDVPYDIHLNRLHTIKPFELPDILSLDNTSYTIAPPVHIVGVPVHHGFGTFRTILVIVLIILILLLLLFCVCKLM